MAAVQSKKRRPGTLGGIIQPKIFGLPIDRDVLFSNHKNMYKKSIEKRQRKLFLKLPFLKNFLKPGEKIVLVTKGYSPATPLQKWIVGWFFIYLKRSLFVFTDHRFFHIPADAGYRYRNTIAEVPYENCQSIEVKGSGLLVEYAGSGVKEKFGGIAGKERRKLREIMKKVPLGVAKQAGSGRFYLCPRCADYLSPNTTACESCRLKFRNKGSATLMALLIPGGGYLYTRHYLLGVMFALLEIGLGVVIGLSLMDVLEGIVNKVFWLAPTLAALLVVKGVAAAHARELVSEFLPAGKKFTPSPGAKKRRNVPAEAVGAAPAR